MLNSIGVVSFVVVLTAVWQLVKSYRPTYQYVRGRAADAACWERHYSAELLPFVQKVRETIQAAFLLRKDDIDRLRPDDRLSAIYRAAYPRPWLADTLEFETLQAALRKEYHVPESLLSTLWAMTVGDVIQLCIAHREDVA